MVWNRFEAGMVSITETGNSVEIKLKIKLKTKYKEIKNSNGETGRGRKSCKFFDEMDRILGHRPTSVPPVLFESSLPSHVCL